MYLINLSFSFELECGKNVSMFFFKCHKSTFVCIKTTSKLFKTCLKKQLYLVLSDYYFFFNSQINLINYKVKFKSHSCKFVFIDALHLISVVATNLKLL